MFVPDISLNSGCDTFMTFNDNMMVPFYDILSDPSFSYMHNPFYDSFRPHFHANYKPIDYFRITFGKHFPLIEFPKYVFDNHELKELKHQINKKNERKINISKLHLNSKKELHKSKNANLIYDKRCQSSVSLGDQANSLFKGSYFPSINLIKENWIKTKTNKENIAEIKPLLKTQNCEEWFEPSLNLTYNHLLQSNESKNQNYYLNLNLNSSILVKSSSNLSENQSHNSNPSFSSIENQSNLDFNHCSNLVEKMFDEQNERFRFDDSVISSSKSSLNNSFLSQNNNQESIKI